MRAERIEQVAVDYVDLFGVQRLFERLDAGDPRLDHVQLAAHPVQVVQPAAPPVNAEYLDLGTVQQEINHVTARETRDTGNQYSQNLASVGAGPCAIHSN